jgi:hypothetical protein
MKIGARQAARIAAGSATQIESAQPDWRRCEVGNVVLSRRLRRKIADVLNPETAKTAVRAAIVVPFVLAVANTAFGNEQTLLFAAFGGFALLVLLEFGGTRRTQLWAYTGFAAAGVGLITLAALCSRDPWLAAGATGVAGFVILLSTDFNGFLATAANGALLLFVLAANVPAPNSAIPDRLLGWGIAAGIGTIAVLVLWPTHRHQDPLTAGGAVRVHSVVRGAVALAIATFIAQRVDLQHGFWVVLATVSVLRTNVLGTGRSIATALVGTAAGIVGGALLVGAIGTDRSALWAALPFAALLAAYVHRASFAAGQAGFTVYVLVLFNLIQPAGWRVGLVRIEDVAIGCAVSLGVGLFLWPRGSDRRHSEVPLVMQSFRQSTSRR